MDLLAILARAAAVRREVHDVDKATEEMLVGLCTIELNKLGGGEGRGRGEGRGEGRKREGEEGGGGRGKGEGGKGGGGEERRGGREEKR